VALGLGFLGALAVAGSAQALTINSPNVSIGSGTIDEIILTMGATDFALTGGTVLGDFTALNGTSATISGGIIDGDLLVPGLDADVTLVGSGFTVNGSNVFPADLTADFCSETGCEIAGTLASGDPISIQGFPLRSGQIHLVPEPVTALLLGIGLMGLALVGRRPRRALPR
jgi:hypothetical protein